MTQKEYASKLISAFYAEFGTERECYGEHPKTLNPAYNLYAGLFRLTIVPKNANFILKLGKTDTGDEQNENETRIYKLAQEQNLQHWFAKPLFVVNAGPYTWHAYEKAYFIGEAGQSPLKEKEVSDEIVERYCSALCADEIDEWPHYIAHEKVVNRLIDFFADYGINDLHNGNWGYSRRARHLIFTDYAGCWI